jgi:hypothetical protein
MQEIEQELAELLAKWFSNYSRSDSEIEACLPAAKAILTSGLVIPVSALDGMAEKLHKAISNLHYRITPYEQYVPELGEELWDLLYNTKGMIVEVHNTINAIKEEAGK